MAVNRGKLGRAVTFMNCLASVVSVIFLPKALIWNKITFWQSTSLNLAELVVNGLTKSISKRYSFFYTIFFFLSDLSLLIVKISGANY